MVSDWEIGHSWGRRTSYISNDCFSLILLHYKVTITRVARVTCVYAHKVFFMIIRYDYQLYDITIWYYQLFIWLWLSTVLPCCLLWWLHWLLRHENVCLSTSKYVRMPSSVHVQLIVFQKLCIAMLFCNAQSVQGTVSPISLAIGVSIVYAKTINFNKNRRWRDAGLGAG